MALAGGYYSGAYLSVGAGLVDEVFNFSQSGSANSSNSNTALNNQSGDDQFSATGSINAGYRIDVNPYFNLGLEADAIFQSAQGEASNTIVNSSSLTMNSHIQTKLSTSFALLFKPGMVFNNQRTLAYLLIGPQWGEFSSSSYTNLVEVLPASTFAVGSVAASESSSYKVGWAAGVGVEEVLNDNFHVGLEYEYVDYGTVYSTNTTNSVFENGSANGSINGSASTVAHSNTVMVKITKQFG